MQQIEKKQKLKELLDKLVEKSKNWPLIGVDGIHGVLDFYMMFTLQSTNEC